MVPVTMPLIGNGWNHMIRILRTYWFKGGFFHWNVHRFNSGDPYVSYRIGPILIKRYKYAEDPRSK